MSRKYETEDYILYYKGDQQTKDQVYKTIVDFFIENKLFDGEDVAQSDRSFEEAPVLLTKLTDEILKFQVEFK